MVLYASDSIGRKIKWVPLKWLCKIVSVIKHNESLFFIIGGCCTPIPHSGFSPAVILYDFIERCVPQLDASVIKYSELLHPHAP